MSRTRLRTRSFVGSAAPTAFAPTDLSGLQLWLDASDAASITQTAGAVSQWSDKSGSGNHFTQTVASYQPTTGTRTLNGLNALDFDGSDDKLDSPSAYYSTIPQGNSTSFVVCQRDLSTGTMRLLSTTGTKWSFRYTGSVHGFYHGDLQPNASKSITANTSQHLLIGQRESNNIRAYYDGGTPATNTNATNPTSIYELKLSHNDSHFNGLISEVLTYNRALTSAEMNQIGQYLSAKWGTPWTDIS